MILVIFKIAYPNYMKTYIPIIGVMFVVFFFLFTINKSPAKTSYIPIDTAQENPRATEAFNTMMDVLTHKRCVNCHPSDHIPKQGEDSHPHYFGITRGENNMGYQATNCNSCHQAENNNYAGVPGAPEWSLAPHSMRWEGLSRVAIAQSMMDPQRNGGRTPEETLHHLTEHELVLWAWNPGVDADGKARELPPVSKEKYIAAVKEWFASGHIIPTE